MFVKPIIVILIVMLLLSSAGCNAISKKIEYDMSSIDAEVTGGNKEFAFNVFRELNKEEINNNIFISPFSLSTALSMTYNGAEGKTKEDMAKALSYADLDITAINTTYKNLLPYLSDIDNEVVLDISNSIWYRIGEPIRQEFITTNRDSFDAEISEIDFSQTDAVNKINSWIKDSTKGKIEKMLEPPIPSDVIMYLINAVYFKGNWTYEFDKENTYPGIFKNIDGEEEAVQMMSMNGTVEYGEDNDYKVIRLPYGNEKLYMYFILPEDVGDINALIENLNNEKFSEIRKSITEEEDVIVGIPRYKVEYGIKNLNDVLKKMGMTSAFEMDADFSKIREGLFISRVLHKAVIEVTEEGSEAAAVTVVEVMESSMEEPTTFVADRPFVFAIRDEDTGTVLFMGKYCRTK